MIIKKSSTREFWYIFVLFLIIFGSVAVGNTVPALAVWSEPTDKPPMDDLKAPLNTGLIDQTKEGNLTVKNLSTGIVTSTSICLGTSSCITDWSKVGGGNFWASSSVGIYSVGTGRVGVGTTSPAYKLGVVGTGEQNVDFYVNGRLKSDNSNGGLWIGSDRFIGGLVIGGGNQIGLYNNGDWRLVANSAGNIGIGTTSPSVKLDVNGSIKTSGGNLYTNAIYGRAGLAENIWLGDNNDIIQILGKVSSSEVCLGGVCKNAWPSANSILPVGASGQTLRNDGTSWISNSILYNNGTNIGIRTTTPGANLVVAGRGTASVMIGERTQFSGYGAISMNGSLNETDYNLMSYNGPQSNKNLYINRPIGWKINFRMGDQDQMVLDSYGRLSAGQFCLSGKCKTDWDSGVGASQWISSFNAIYYNSGNVGIGLSNPEVKLQINQPGTGAGLVYLSGAGDAYQYSGINLWDNGTDFNSNYLWGIFHRKDISHAFQIVGKGNSNSSWISPLTILSGSGNVGINLDNPRTSLEVKGWVTVSGDGARFLMDDSLKSTSSVWAIDNSAGSFRLFNQPDISTAGKVRMMLTSEGDTYFGVFGLAKANIKATGEINGQSLHIIDANGTNDIKGILNLDKAKLTDYTGTTQACNSSSKGMIIYRNSVGDNYGDFMGCSCNPSNVCKWVSLSP